MIEKIRMFDEDTGMVLPQAEPHTPTPQRAMNKLINEHNTLVAWKTVLESDLCGMCGMPMPCGLCGTPIPIRPR